MERTNLEKYLAGEPITEELRQVRDGLETGPQPWEQGFPWRGWAGSPGEPGDRPLTRADRELLKEAKGSGVLAIIEQTLKRALRTHVESATMDSENDPLGRAGEVSRQWAYVVMYRRALFEFAQLVDAEIAELDREVGN